MSHRRPAGGTWWLAHTTLAGGAPCRVTRLTKRGAQSGQTMLTGGDAHNRTPAQRELADRLRWAVL
jgi:hypothetical protein